MQWFLRYSTQRTDNKRLNKLDYTKIKNFCALKDTLKEVEKTAYGMEEKYLQTTDLSGEFY